MSLSDFVIRQERQRDAAAVARLSASAFGPGRFARSAYRVREGADASSTLDQLKLCAWRGEQLVGSLHFTPILVGGASGALLLGPLAIAPDRMGQGWGCQLLEEGLKRAEAAGYRLVVLVGDLSYYGRLDFVVSPSGRIILPGPVDPARLLVKELVSGALAEYWGDVRYAN